MESIPQASTASNNTAELLNGELPVTSLPNGTKAQINEPRDDASANVPKDIIECDCLVVGAGFSGITSIHRFRKLGLSVKCFESGSDFGGVWYWNRYPGARVDSEAPFYQLNIPEVYQHWYFTQRFSDHTELREYVAHVDKILDLRKDVYFHARVVDAAWDLKTNRWTVKTAAGHVARAKYLMLATGLLHRTYTPEFPGLQNYKGEIYHSGAWPKNFSGKGKRLGLIGAGATAVQITQELGKEADQLTVFVRRPSYCLPMRQRRWTEEEQRNLKAYYPAIFRAGRDSFNGFPTTRQPVGVLDVSKQEREALFEDLWGRGAFQFGHCNYNNVVLDKEANKVVYEFWCRKVRERLTDPAKQRVMAPEVAPYYFGTKRNPLEHDYYEVLNRSNVSIHDLSKVPLKSFHEKGLIMDDDERYEFDAIVLATGFDSYTGSLTNMGLKNKAGTALADLWKQGISTYLGIMISGFPNVFMAYTPQAPTALSNGPTIIEAQVETIAHIITKCQAENIKTIEPQRAAEEEWKQLLDTMSKTTLIPYTDSWWNGANIPGKKAENMIYVGGINSYEKQIRERIDGWHGFDIDVAI